MITLPVQCLGTLGPVITGVDKYTSSNKLVVGKNLVWSISRDGNPVPSLFFSFFKKTVESSRYSVVVDSCLPTCLFSAFFKTEIYYGILRVWNWCGFCYVCWISLWCLVRASSPGVTRFFLVFCFSVSVDSYILERMADSETSLETLATLLVNLLPQEAKMENMSC